MLYPSASLGTAAHQTPHEPATDHGTQDDEQEELNQIEPLLHEPSAPGASADAAPHT